MACRSPTASDLAGRAHLKLAFNWDLKPLYDVIARLKGSTFPDQWVIRGNHHDGWVNGAEDPGSGMSAMLEEARALGELRKQGWTPKRTIVFTAWDGEEPALLGSTEWAETHAAELRQKAVVYLNSDGNGRGYLEMEGSHTLEHFINDVAATSPIPRPGCRCGSARRRAPSNAPSPRRRKRSARAPICASARAI